MQKVIIVEDHPLFREGIKLILVNSQKFTLIGEYTNGKEFIDNLGKEKPDLVLMDIAMPVMDGIEATKLAIEKDPSLKILVLSMYGDEEYYYHMINAGAKGFILKEARSQELLDAMTWVANGENYFSQELLRKIIFKFSPDGMNKLKDKTQSEEISVREFDVLKLICHGLTNAEIAEQLYISQRTVEGHRASLLKKTNTKNTVSLIMHSLRNGLIKV